MNSNQTQVREEFSAAIRAELENKSAVPRDGVSKLLI
jgi:hypothetical protein